MGAGPASAAVQVPCHDSGHSINGHREYNCGFWETSPVVNSAGSRVGTLHSGTNWVLCQWVGKDYQLGSYRNKYWAYTESDQGKWGWVNATYGKGGTNEGAWAGVPKCSQSAHYNGRTAPGYPPQTYQKSGASVSCYVTNYHLATTHTNGVCQRYLRSDGLARMRGYNGAWHWCEEYNHAYGATKNPVCFYDII